MSSGGEDSENTYANDSTFTVSMIASICMMIIGLFLRCLAYRRRRNSDNRNSSEIEDPDSIGRPKVTLGLGKSTIESLPVFKFRKNDGLVESSECAVCLSLFEENELLRLLPGCKHAFHLPCVDKWLESHSNCPLCRGSISSTLPSFVLVQQTSTPAISGGFTDFSFQIPSPEASRVARNNDASSHQFHEDRFSESRTNRISARAVYFASDRATIKANGSENENEFLRPQSTEVVSDRAILLAQIRNLKIDLTSGKELPLLTRSLSTSFPGSPELLIAQENEGQNYPGKSGPHRIEFPIVDLPQASYTSLTDHAAYSQLHTVLDIKSESSSGSDQESRKMANSTHASASVGLESNTDALTDTAKGRTMTFQIRRPFIKRRSHSVGELVGLMSRSDRNRPPPKAYMGELPV